MVDLGVRNRLSLLGLIPAIVLVGALFLFLLNNPRSPGEPSYLAFVLYFVFALVMGVVLAVISARAYLISGSLGVLLAGMALLINGILLTLAQYGATPAIVGIPDLNQSVTTANISLLIASALLFLSAALSWSGNPSIDSVRQRKLILVVTAVMAAIVVAAVAIAAEFDLVPIFFTSSGPTPLRQAVLIISAIFLFISCVLFVSRYWRTRLPIQYWYSLGLISFTISLIGLVFTVHIGDAMNWCARIGLYFTGIYFLLAVMSAGQNSEKKVDLAEEWAAAFVRDREQIDILFANMINAFSYHRIITDKEGRPIDYVFLEFNEAFVQNTGIKKEDAIGKRVTEILPGIKDDPADLINVYGKVALQGRSIRFETFFPPLDKWYTVSAYSPKKGYFITIFEDITEKKRSEKELRDYAEELERSNDELKQFAYITSHDLQEPLRMVISYLTLLNKKFGGKLEPEAIEYLNNAVEGGVRMRALIDDLLAYSRVDTVQKPFGPADMNRVVQETLVVLKASIEEEKAHIEMGELPTITTDESQMKQLMLNLIGNAIKFHGLEKPEISITALRGSDEWTFRVKDNGIGLNMEYADKIFQMFQRLHTRDQYPGTGVGLAIAKKIVERHGGRIWVESEEGKGTTFFFTIPGIGVAERNRPLQK